MPARVTMHAKVYCSSHVDVILSYEYDIPLKLTISNSLLHNNAKVNWIFLQINNF